MWKMQSSLTSHTNSRQLAYAYWLLFGSPHYNIQSRRLETSVCFAHQSLEHDCHTLADGKHLLNSCRIYECWFYSFSTKDFPVNYDSNSKRIYMQASAWRPGTAYKEHYHLPQCLEGSRHYIPVQLFLLPKKSGFCEIMFYRQIFPTLQPLKVLSPINSTYTVIAQH